MLYVIDGFTRRRLAILVAQRLRSDAALQCLTDLFVEHGSPEHIRSDNGPEFAAKAFRHWLGRLGVKTLFIEAGSPRENVYCESFNSKLRDEVLNGEIFTTLCETQVRIEEGWRRHYGAVRPHSRWATDRRPPKRSCRQPVACPTLRSVQPTGWPILPERNSRVGVAVGGRPDPAVCRRCGFLLRLER